MTTLASAMRHIPTAEECRVIRLCALRGAGEARVRVQPTTRVSLANRSVNLNVALISDDPRWGDTDLDDYVTWAAFRKDGFDMAPGGRAIIDCAVYSLGHMGQLETHVTAHWEGGKLVRVDETSKPGMWRAL